MQCVSSFRANMEFAPSHKSLLLSANAKTIYFFIQKHYYQENGDLYKVIFTYYTVTNDGLIQVLEK